VLNHTDAGATGWTTIKDFCTGVTPGQYDSRQQLHQTAQSSLLGGTLIGISSAGTGKYLLMATSALHSQMNFFHDLNQIFVRRFDKIRPGHAVVLRQQSPLFHFIKKLQLGYPRILSRSENAARDFRRQGQPTATCTYWDCRTLEPTASFGSRTNRYQTPCSYRSLVRKSILVSGTAEFDSLNQDTQICPSAQCFWTR
jgi:hypothetical protein